MKPTDAINDLNLLNPTLKEKILQLLDLCKKEGLNVGVFETYRTSERSNLLYKKGTGAKAGDSYHNYGLACDIVFKDGKGWTWDSKMNWKKLGELGKFVGLEWGGDGSAVDVRKGDMPHFQLSFGLKIKDLLAGKRPETVDPYKSKALDRKICNNLNWDKPLTKYETMIILDRLGLL